MAEPGSHRHDEAAPAVPDSHGVATSASANSGTVLRPILFPSNGCGRSVPLRLIERSTSALVTSCAAVVLRRLRDEQEVREDTRDGDYSKDDLGAVTSRIEQLNDGSHRS